MGGNGARTTSGVHEEVAFVEVWPVLSVVVEVTEEVDEDVEDDDDVEEEEEVDVVEGEPAVEDDVEEEEAVDEVEDCAVALAELVEEVVCTDEVVWPRMPAPWKARA